MTKSNIPPGEWNLGVEWPSTSNTTVSIRSVHVMADATEESNGKGGPKLLLSHLLGKISRAG